MNFHNEIIVIASVLFGSIISFVSLSLGILVGLLKTKGPSELIHDVRHTIKETKKAVEDIKLPQNPFDIKEIMNSDSGFRSIDPSDLNDMITNSKNVVRKFNEKEN